MQHSRTQLLIAITGFAFGLSAFADDNPHVRHFKARVEPLLVEKCLGCHDGSKEADSALSLTSRTALLAGGEFGPAIVSGSSETSLLIQAVRRTHKELKMPPDPADRLSAAQVSDLQRWVDEGAVWPGETAPPDKRDAAVEAADTDHWAFRPATRPSPPEVDAIEWSHSAIDRFVYSMLGAKGMTPTPETDRRSLIRRATFDLTGLPPTPDEIDAFLTDTSPEAFQRVVDRMLDSPRYGERWGRHWLDVARYADTQGDPGDFPIPTAHLYRNWVIDALNADMPYDRFVQAQIAGDLLANRAENLEEARGLVVATGFIAISRRFGNTQFADHHLTIEDTIDTIGRGIMGITLRCARCHDHKFDPLLQSDYYRIYGILNSTRYPSMGASDAKSPSSLSPLTPDPKDRKAADAYFAKLARYGYQIRNHHRPWLQPTLNEYEDVANVLEVGDLSSEAWAKANRRRQELLAAFDAKFRDLMLHGLDWLKQEQKRMAENPPLEMVFAVGEAQPSDARVHRRGDPRNLGEVVRRGFPQAIVVASYRADFEEPKLSGSGRLELARWLTAADNPLTARVIVNRVWQHHFGRGIVATPSNFGIRGTAPSHPALLDYLTNVFVEEDGWSLKMLHRRIMLSRAYRAASHNIAANMRLDPENTYLWRYSRRRLDAESIRDAMLAVSGNLDLSRGGPFPFPHWVNGSFNLNSPFKASFPSNRRSVYLMTQRLFQHPFFALFDGPDRSQSTGERESSTLPTQVLYLMNSPFVAQQANGFAERITRTTSDEPTAIALAYQAAYGRPPQPEETEAMHSYFKRLLAENGATTVGVPRRKAWSSLAKVIFASSEFLFVD